MFWIQAHGTARVLALMFAGLLRTFVPSRKTAVEYQGVIPPSQTSVTEFLQCIFSENL